jgi:hypothetical protein
MVPLLMAGHRAVMMSLPIPPLPALVTLAASVGLLVCTLPGLTAAFVAEPSPGPEPGAAPEPVGVVFAKGVDTFPLVATAVPVEVADVTNTATFPLAATTRSCGTVLPQAANINPMTTSTTGSRR